jgi:glycosyltransferase involved in cell wall biosynthesis
MKVLQIVTQMEAGGAQRIAYLLHEGLRCRGHETELCFLYLKRPTYIGKPGVQVLANQRPSFLGYLLLLVKLFARIRASKPDVIITHTHYANILGQFVGAVAGVRQRLAVHHSILTKYPTTQIAVSNSVVDSMSGYPERYKRTVRTVYNGVAPGQTASVSSPQPANLPEGGLRILHVGRLSREKNHQAILESLQQLPGTNLVLVGDGELRAKLEHEVQILGLGDRVRFLGEITPEEVRAIMGVCDLLMFPSTYEAMPMALLEAMSAGMPIVASDIPANRELLQDCGVLLPPDPTQLAGAAARLFAKRNEAATLGEKAAKRARQFTVDAMADGYENLFLS